MEFTYVRDEKAILWARHPISVIAETKERADAISHARNPEDECNEGEDVEWGESEILWDSEEVIGI